MKTFDEALRSVNNQLFQDHFKALAKEMVPEIAGHRLLMRLMLDRVSEMANGPIKALATSSAPEIDVMVDLVTYLLLVFQFGVMVGQEMEKGSTKPVVESFHN